MENKIIERLIIINAILFIIAFFNTLRIMNVWSETEITTWIRKGSSTDMTSFSYGKTITRKEAMKKSGEYEYCCAWCIARNSRRNFVYYIKLF